MIDLDESKNFAMKLRVLAEPERFLIIQALREGFKNVSQIGAIIRQKMGNVSHHLQVLREAGIVESQREGRFVRYRLAPAAYVASKNGLADQLAIGCCRIELPKRS